MPPRLRTLQIHFDGRVAQHARPGLASHVRAPLLTLLKHQHLTGDGPGGFVKYDDAAAIQDDLRANFLKWKSQTLDERSLSYPQPMLLSFEATPTFTLGRRQNALTGEQASRIRSELSVSLPQRRSPISQSFIPEVRKTNRGGLTTYHGPGQIVFWPVLDMHSDLYERFSVTSYASHLETTTERFLSTLFHIKTCTTRGEPGVWVTDPKDGPARKIAALGVHHRRHVTALGIAVNIDIPISGSEAVNPWARFVPCGLDGKLVTSVVAEGGDVAQWDMPTLAGRWARMFEEGLEDASKRGSGHVSRKPKEEAGFFRGGWNGMLNASVPW